MSLNAVSVHLHEKPVNVTVETYYEGQPDLLYLQIESGDVTVNLHTTTAEQIIDLGCQIADAGRAKRVEPLTAEDKATVIQDPRAVPLEYADGQVPAAL
jgi:hypothetical protein